MIVLLPALIPERYVPEGLKVYERSHWLQNRVPKYGVYTVNGYSIVDYKNMNDVMAFLKGYKGMQDLGIVKEVSDGTK